VLALLLVSSIVLQVGTPQRLAMVPARVIAASTSSDLRMMCGVDRPIDACTRFVGFQLTATCNGNSLSASARFMPLIMIMAPKAHSHELLHIADVRQSAERHLRNLESRGYASAAECQAAAARASDEFARDMYAFVRESNKKRHPNRR
jgi:hypothetical protein